MKVAALFLIWIGGLMIGISIGAKLVINLYKEKQE